MIQLNALNPRWQALQKLGKKETLALLKRLDDASEAGDITLLKLILEEDNLLLDRVLTEVRDNPLHIAASHGHVNFAIEILQLKPELAKKLNKEGQSPLHLAVARGHIQIVEKLIDQVGSTDICNVVDKDGYLPIHTAALHGKTDVIVMFIERCGQQILHAPTRTKETLLHLAVKANRLDTFHDLINRGVMLDAMDDKGNTCLHIAVARRNYRVITELVKHVGTEINSTNTAGQTPLDVLCDSWQCFDDVSLVNMIRSAGGMRAVELTDLKSICIHPSEDVTSSNSSERRMTANLRADKMNRDASTLLVVATLVATITFQVVLNPPGGFVQGDTNTLDQDKSSPPGTPPPPPRPHSGTPVFLEELEPFYILSSLALFATVSVILLLLCGVPHQNKILMKFLVWVVWFAVFCTALAFSSAFSVLYGWSISTMNWIFVLFMAWYAVFAMASLWVSIRVIIYLLRKGTLLKGKTRYWIAKWAAKLSWSKLNRLLKMTICIILSTFVLFILLAVNKLVFSMMGLPQYVRFMFLNYA